MKYLVKMSVDDFDKVVVIEIKQITKSLYFEVTDILLKGDGRFVVGMKDSVLTESFFHTPSEVIRLFFKYQG